MVNKVSLDDESNPNLVTNHALLETRPRRSLNNFFQETLEIAGPCEAKPLPVKIEADDELSRVVELPPLELTVAKSLSDDIASKAEE